MTLITKEEADTKTLTEKETGYIRHCQHRTHDLNLPNWYNNISKKRIK